MRKNRSPFIYLVTFLLFVVFCLVIFAFIWVVIQLPQRASTDFGPPSDGLNIIEKYRFGIDFYLHYSELKEAKDEAGQPMLFQIETGESVDSIALRMEDAGLIRNASEFRLYLIYSGLDTQIQTGKFLIDPKLNMIEIAYLLRDATPSVVDFGILPGWRIEEIAASLPSSGLDINPQDFIDLAKNPAGITLPLELTSLSNLEGFLYPDSYEVDRDTTVEELITLFVQHFEDKITSEMRTGFQQQGLTLYQAVTLASIVQREAMIDEEQPVIASVFLNRLQAGMNLESDPTVQYAVGYNPVQNTWWTNPLSSEDLALSSLYNTYLIPGLTPSPISNPGISALEAVAFPASTDYYYFQAACDGSGKHNFERTFEEHLQNLCQ
jgi:UPF0755 protein